MIIKQIPVFDIISWGCDEMKNYHIQCKNYFAKNDIIQVLNEDNTLSCKLLVIDLIKKEDVSILKCTTYPNKHDVDLNNKKIRYYSNSINIKKL